MAENHYFIHYCSKCSSVYQDGKWTKAKDCNPFLLDLLTKVEAVIFIKETCIDCFKKERT